MLSNTTFSSGFVAGLPKGTKLIHKFGEWNNETQFELHESGIIYFHGKPFLLTAMTRGTDNAALEKALRTSAETAYKYFSTLP